MSTPVRGAGDSSVAGTPKGTKRRHTGGPEDQVKRRLSASINFNGRNLLAKKFKHDDVVIRMEPEQLTMDYYHKSGLGQVLLFECPPEKLGMMLPPPTCTVRSVMNRVGRNRILEVFDAKQNPRKMSMEAFMHYYETPVAARKEVLNVISLEVSHTEMEEQVRAPALVRQVDMASSWPDERKQRVVTFEKEKDGQTLFSIVNKYPRVENYCLMSAQSAYTGFHIDFHGSSVWYHVLRGEKIFFIVEPTPANIARYEEYEQDTDNNDQFFGDLVEKCTRVQVLAGQTLMLPSGWIHSVYTPQDSLVFGGNYIHPRSVEMQQTIIKHEEKMKFEKHQKYPQADEVAFFYMDNIVQQVTGRRHIRPVSKNRQDYGEHYVGEGYIEAGGRAHVIVEAEYEKGGWAWKEFPESADFNQIKPLEDKVGKMMKELREKTQKLPDSDSFVFADNPLLLFHPNLLNIDAALSCFAKPLNNFLSKALPEMEINEDILRTVIHPKVVSQLELLIAGMLHKDRVDLPEGLTRPNSLVHSMATLLKRRRELAEIDGDAVDKFTARYKLMKRQIRALEDDEVVEKTGLCAQLAADMGEASVEAVPVASPVRRRTRKSIKKEELDESANALVLSQRSMGKSEKKNCHRDAPFNTWYKVHRALFDKMYPDSHFVEKAKYKERRMLVRQTEWTGRGTRHPQDLEFWKEHSEQLRAWEDAAAAAGKQCNAEHCHSPYCPLPSEKSLAIDTKKIKREVKKEKADVKGIMVDAKEDKKKDAMEDESDQRWSEEAQSDVASLELGDFKDVEEEDNYEVIDGAPGEEEENYEEENEGDETEDMDNEMFEEAPGEEMNDEEVEEHVEDEEEDENEFDEDEDKEKENFAAACDE